MQGMNYTEISDPRRIAALLEDDKIVAEQKMDGVRVLAHFEAPGEVRFTQRGGRPVGFHAAKQHLKRLAQHLLSVEYPPLVGYVVDGELMIATGEYRMFDMIWPDMLHEEYQSRRHNLASYFGRDDRGVLSIVRMAYGFEKYKLREAVLNGGGEGFMLKHLESPYEPGKRVTHSVKVKFVKTADAVVTKVTRGRNEAGREIGSINFAVNDGEKAVPMGACSVIGKPEVKEGDVIEVAYLYRGAGGMLIQPRMMRIRHDKLPIECTEDQFPAYSREVF